LRLTGTYLEREIFSPLATFPSPATTSSDEPRRSELRPVGGGQRQLRLAAARGRQLQNCLLDRGQGFGGAAAVRQQSITLTK